MKIDLDLKERYATALKLRDEGKKFTEIGKALGVSGPRAHGLYCAAMLQKQRSEKYTGAVKKIGLSPERVREMLR